VPPWFECELRRVVRSKHNWFRQKNRGHTQGDVMHTETAADLARVIADLDAIVNRAASGDAPADLWAELRMIRAAAMAAFERLTGKSVGEAIGRRS
jgi:hypothetical protein